MKQNDKQVVFFKDCDLIITNHAIERMIERWSLASPGTSIPKKPIKTIEHLLKRVSLEKMNDEIRLHRLLSNGCVEAQYWKHEDGYWRFVTIFKNGCRQLVTIEYANR